MVGPVIDEVRDPARPAETAAASPALGALAPARRAPRAKAARALAPGRASEGMLARRVRVAAGDVVFVKGVLEASEGLASLFAERGGELTIAAPACRAAELAELLGDLERELGARVLEEGVHG